MNIEYRIYRPSVWDFTSPPSDGMGGPAVADRLMLYIVKTDECGDEEVVGKMSLKEVVRDDIEGASTWQGVVADEFDPDLIGLRDGLRKLADEVDDALKTSASAKRLQR